MKMRMSRRGPRSAPNTELNLVPVLDCLVVIVAFLLVSGTYLSVGALGVSISSSAEASRGRASQGQQPVQIAVELGSKKSFTVSLQGREKKTIVIPAQSGHWNISGLTKELNTLKLKWPRVAQLTLKATRGVPYQSVVSALEASQKSHPDVVLGGF